MGVGHGHSFNVVKFARAHRQTMLHLTIHERAARVTHTGRLLHDPSFYQIISRSKQHSIRFGCETVYIGSCKVRTRELAVTWLSGHMITACQP